MRSKIKLRITCYLMNNINLKQVVHEAIYMLMPTLVYIYALEVIYCNMSLTYKDIHESVI